MANNGDKVKHRITGIEGIVVGITNWLYGCRRVHVQLIETREGRPQELIAFDEPEVEVITAKFLSADPSVLQTTKPTKQRSTGGPRNYAVTKKEDIA